MKPAIIASICSGVSPLPSKGRDAPSVAIPPGAMALTRTPCGASSRARFLVNMSTPPFEAS